MQTESVTSSKPQVKSKNDPSTDWPTLDVLRLRYIHRAIEHTNNNKTRAAEILGISLKTMHNKLKEYGSASNGGPAFGAGEMGDD